MRTIVLMAILALSLTGGCATKGGQEVRAGTGERVERPTPSPMPIDPDEYLKWTATASEILTQIPGTTGFSFLHERVLIPGTYEVEDGLVTVPATVGLYPPISTTDRTEPAELALKLIFFPGAGAGGGTGAAVALPATLSVELPLSAESEVVVFVPATLRVTSPATAGILAY